MTDPLEEMAREIVQEYENELQFPKEDRFKDLEVKITEALKTLRSKTRKEDASISKNLKPKDRVRGDVMLSIQDAVAEAILKKDEEESNV